jgi:large subunit ribosomal protein L21
MYAIVQVGGRQYRAAPGDRLVVDRLNVEPGTRFQLADVRMLVAEEGDSAETQIGRPRLEEVSVVARAVSHFRGPKILVFKYKPKKRYRRRQGFRAELTELRIEEVRPGGYEAEAVEESPAPRRAAPRSSKVAAAPSADQVEGAAAEEPAAVGMESAAVDAAAKGGGATRRRAAARPVDEGPAAGSSETKAGRPRGARAGGAAKAVGPVTRSGTGRTASRTRSKPKEAEEQVNGS